MTHDAQCEMYKATDMCRCAERALAQAQQQVVWLKATVHTRDLAIKRWCDELAQAQGEMEIWHASLADTINTGIREVGNVHDQIKKWDIESLRAGINEIVYASNRRLAQAQGELQALKDEKYTAWRFGTPFDPTGAKTGTEINSLRAEIERLDGYYRGAMARLEQQLNETSQDILRAQVYRVALQEIAVHEGDPSLEAAQMRSAARAALTEPGGQP